MNTLDNEIYVKQVWQLSRNKRMISTVPMLNIL